MPPRTARHRGPGRTRRRRPPAPRTLGPISDAAAEPADVVPGTTSSASPLRGRTRLGFWDAAPAPRPEDTRPRRADPARSSQHVAPRPEPPSLLPPPLAPARPPPASSGARAPGLLRGDGGPSPGSTAHLLLPGNSARRPRARSPGLRPPRLPRQGPAGRGKRSAALRRERAGRTPPPGTGERRGEEGREGAEGEKARGRAAGPGGQHGEGRGRRRAAGAAVPGAGRRGCGRAGPLRARPRAPRRRNRRTASAADRERPGRRWPRRPGPT